MKQLWHVVEDVQVKHCEGQATQVLLAMLTNVFDEHYVWVTHLFVTISKKEFGVIDGV